MAYFLKVKPELDRVFRKLIKKNRKLYEILMKTADEVILNPQHYANLRAPLQDWKRVHIDGNFVLAFSVDEDTKTVILEDFDNHDKIYS